MSTQQTAATDHDTAASTDDLTGDAARTGRAAPAASAESTATSHPSTAQISVPWANALGQLAGAVQDACDPAEEPLSCALVWSGANLGRV